jgi:hypothetical protein
MNLILVGCEFAGKTTLAHEIVEWSKRTLGRHSHFHDHFTIPSTELEGDAKEEYRKTSPQIKEMFQRFMMNYHMSPDFYGNVDHHLMGFHIEEAVYAPLYYGYGGENSGSPVRSPQGQRSEMARQMEEVILERAPNVVLVLLRAAPETIRQRMASPEDRRTGPRDSEPFGPPTARVVQDGDIEHVLERFEEEFQNSLIQKRFALDTSSATIDETMAEFVRKTVPLLSTEDRHQIEQHRA